MHTSGNAKNPGVKQYYANQAGVELVNILVSYAAGKVVSGLIKGVSRVTGRSAATSAMNKALFRNDTRAPDEIFKSGFDAKGANTSIPEYVEANEPSIFVGASKSPVEAAKRSTKGYVYVIENNGNGLDVNNYYKAIEGRENPFAGEQEVIFEGIPAYQVKGVFPVTDGKIDTKGFISNPNYKPKTQ